MIECHCKFDSSETSETIEIPDGMCQHREIRSISVDRCIAPIIRSLLRNGIEPLSCCCGHKTEQESVPRPFPPHPSLVIAEKYSVKDCQEIADMIATIDDRQWDIQQWKLVKFEPKEEKEQRMSQDQFENRATFTEHRYAIRGGDLVGFCMSPAGPSGLPLLERTEELVEAQCLSLMDYQEKADGHRPQLRVVEVCVTVIEKPKEEKE